MPSTGSHQLTSTQWVVALLAGIVLAGWLYGCGPEPAVESAAAERAISVPHPNLDSMDPAVAAELRSQREELERMLAANDQDANRLAAALGSLAKSYQAHRLVEAAEACFQAAHDLAPQEFAWSYYLGILAARRGDFATASAAFTSSLEVRPRDVPALIRLGDLETDQGELDHARSRYTRALEVDPSLAAAEFGLGRVASRGGDHAAAVKHFQRVLELQPAATVVQYHLGQSYRELGNLELAEEALASSGPVKVAIPDPLLSEVNALAASSSPFLVQGQAALRDGRLSVAARAFQRAIEADADNARAYQSLASVLSLVRDFDGAARNLEQAARLEPNNPQVLYDLATAEAAGGDDAAAASHLQDLLSIEPDNLDARLDLAAALTRLGRVEAAETNYRAVLAADPGHALARAQLGTLLAQSGRTSEAVDLLRRATEQDPDNADTRLNLSIALAETGAFAEAIAQQQHVLTLTDDPAILARTEFHLGNLLLRTGDAEGALRHFQGAVAHDDTHLPAHLHAGNLLAGNGRFQDALPHFERVQTLDPDYPGAWLSHATALVHLQREAQAVALLQERLRRQPDDGAAVHALARLLAAAADVNVRDGGRAIEFAQSAIRSGAQPLYIETLAMAQAQGGQTEAAQRTQLDLMSTMRSRGARAIPERLERNLERYRSGLACCDRPDDVLPLAIAGK